MGQLRGERRGHCTVKRVSNDVSHRDCIHWIVSRDGDDSGPVGHNDVLSLAYDPKTGPLQGTDRLLVIDAGKFGHLSGRHLDPPN